MDQSTPNLNKSNAPTNQQITLGFHFLHHLPKGSTWTPIKVRSRKPFKRLTWALDGSWKEATPHKVGGGGNYRETFFQVKIIRSLWPLKGVFGAGNMYTSVWYLQTSPNHLNELTLLSCIPQNIQTFLYIDPRCPTDMSKRCGNTILCGMKFSHLFFLTNLPNSFYFLPVKNAKINLPIQFSVFLGEIKSDSKSEGVRLIFQQSQASNKTLTLIKENLDCISLMRQCSWTLKVTSWSRCPCQKSKSVWYKNAFNTVSKIQTWHQEETLFIPILIAILGSYDFQEAYSRRIFIAIIGITSEMRLQVTSGPKSPWVSTLDNERHLDQWNNGEVAMEVAKIQTYKYILYIIWL